MTRREIIKKLTEAGFSFREGGEHTGVYDSHGKFRTTLPRHKGDVPPGMVRSIEKLTGVKLR